MIRLTDLTDCLSRGLSLPVHIAVQLSNCAPRSRTVQKKLTDSAQLKTTICNECLKAQAERTKQLCQRKQGYIWRMAHWGLKVCSLNDYPRRTYVRTHYRLEGGMVRSTAHLAGRLRSCARSPLRGVSEVQQVRLNCALLHTLCVSAFFSWRVFLRKDTFSRCTASEVS